MTTTTELVLPGVDVTEIGVRFEGVDFETWTMFGYQLSRHETFVMWAAGDWIVYGSDHFPDRYAVAAAATGLSQKTCANAAAVSRRVPMAERVEGLTWGHHAEVAAVSQDDRKRLLSVAEREGLSVRALRAIVDQEDRERAMMAGFDPATDPSPPPASADKPVDFPTSGVSGSANNGAAGEPEPIHKPDGVSGRPTIHLDRSRLEAIARKHGLVRCWVDLATGECGLLRDQSSAA